MARMHQTTVRFGPDLWAALESASRRSGVSVAQYLRDAAVARLALAGGSERGREQPEFPATLPVRGRPVRLAQRIGAEISSAEAVRAQGRLARDRAKQLRTEADGLRRQTSGGGP